MPVRRRSQRLQQKNEKIQEQTNMTHSEVRRSKRLQNKHSKQEMDSSSSQNFSEIEQKSNSQSQSETTSTSPPNTQSTSSIDDHDLVDYQQKIEEFRKSLKNMMDSPSSAAAMRQQMRNKPDPSPRIERITIKQNEREQMEFLIPPNNFEEPMEIRERIRAALSPELQPQTLSYAVPEPLNQPMFDEATRLWSPNIPSYDSAKADRVSKWLFIFIFTVLTAVFCFRFQTEIVAFMNTTVIPNAHSLLEQCQTFGTNMWNTKASFAEVSWTQTQEMVNGIKDYVVKVMDNKINMKGMENVITE